MSATMSAASSIERRHEALLIRGAGVTPEERASLLESCIAAGASTPAGRERDRLQAILFFWAGDQVSRGERNPTMSPPELAPASEPDAAGAEQPATAPDATGAGQPAASPVPDLAPRTVVRLAALARQWKAERRAGYLLTDKALVEAEAYADTDPDIRELVEASRLAQEKRRSRRLAAGLVFVIVLATFALSAIVVWERARRKEADDARELATQQSKAQVSIFAERTDAYNRGAQELQAAVDALAENDVVPLRTLLRSRTAVSPDLLARLQIEPGAVVSADANVVVPVANVAPPNQKPVLDVGQCSGWLWLGSSADSRIEGGRDPASLKAGDTAALDARGDIRLRDQPPSSSYVMGAQTGIVPAGSSFKVDKPAVSFMRPNGAQFWAAVKVSRTFCTTVYLQFDNLLPDVAERVRAVIAALGVRTPPAQEVASTSKVAEVRYFFPDDAAMAGQVAQALAGSAGVKTFKVVPLLDFPRKPSTGTIEVWLTIGP